MDKFHGGYRMCPWEVVQISQFKAGKNVTKKKLQIYHDMMYMYPKAHQSHHELVQLAPCVAAPSKSLNGSGMKRGYQK